MWCLAEGRTADAHKQETDGKIYFDNPFCAESNLIALIINFGLYMLEGGVNRPGSILTDTSRS